MIKNPLRFELSLLIILVFSTLQTNTYGSNLNIGVSAFPYGSIEEEAWIYYNLSPEDSKPSIAYHETSDGNIKGKTIVFGNPASAFSNRIAKVNTLNAVGCHNSNTHLTAPNLIPIVKDVNNTSIIAALTELQLNKKDDPIYIASRHAFESLEASDLKQHDQILKSGYKIYEIENVNNNLKLDIILIAKDLEKLKISLENISNQISLQSENTGDTQTQYYSQWISWQFGSIGIEDASKQCSEGNGFAEGILSDGRPSGFYALQTLNNSHNSNFTSPGSSGSLVWLISSNRSQLIPLGVIQCLQKQPPGSAQESLVRVIGFNKIAKSKLNQVTFEELKNSKDLVQTFKDCIKIDRNGFGGE